MKKVYEDDIQIAYEDKEGARITSLKVNDRRYHSLLCGCDLCLQPERSKREDSES